MTLLSVSLIQRISPGMGITLPNIGGYMNNTQRPKNFVIYALAVSITFLAAAGVTAAQDGRSSNLKTSIERVRSLPSGATVPAAGASLSRNNDAVFGTISTSGLLPGSVVTMWWAIFNNPQFCANPECAAPDLNTPAVNGSLQYGGGYVVGANGRADFSGYLAAGDNTGAVYPFANMPNPAPGIALPKSAQIHLVIRSHGPASSTPETLIQQLTMFNGGCGGPCPNIQAAVFDR
jgi:hypothetical protein